MVCLVGSLAGAYCMGVTVAALHFCHQHFNQRSTWSAFLAANAYTAYIIHPLVVIPVTWSYVVILRHVNAGNESFSITFDDEATSSSCLTSEANRHNDDLVIFGGFFYTSILSLMLTYPAAALIRHIPGAKEILG